MNYADKPFVALCSYCQKEHPEVGKQVQAQSKEVNFSHGICKRHSVEMMKQMGLPPDKIQAKLQSMYSGDKPGLPDLSQRPDLVKLYSMGIFTKEQLEKARQESQQKKAELTERLQKLAGIRS